VPLLENSDLKLQSPILLTIAGSDCCSGAGIQADLKTFSSHHCHGLTAVTCIVAETPEKVASIHPVPPAILQDQIRILLESYPVAAIKTGMLYSKVHLLAVEEILSQHCSIPLVIDPVMVATSGASLIDENAIQAYKERLIPLAKLITPNLPEASVLLDKTISSSHELEPAAQELSERFQCSVLLKGGHLTDSDHLTDVLWHDGKSYLFTHPKIDIACTHGTGCTLSAAITANLANGLSMETAVGKAISWLQKAIKNSFQWVKPNNQGNINCLNHLK